MKPSAAKPAANSPGTAPPEAPAGAGVTDELKAIDVAPLERLLELRKEESQLEEFRTRAEQMKDKVQEVVWRRVVSDYTTRVAALEEQSTPLKTQVRAEYQKLRALLDRTKSLNESAELEKAELEFRHAVGELSKKQLDERLKAPLEVLERCRVDLGAIDAQKARFLSAFASEAELEAPPAPAPPPRREAPAPSPPPAPPAAAAPELEADATVFTPNPLTADEADAGATVLAPNPLTEEADATILARNPLPQTTAMPAPEPSDATSVVSADEVAAASKPPVQPAPPKKPASDDANERTFMLPAAGLLIKIENASPREYRLAAMNYLGRADDSHIVISRPGVSRKHALIVVGAGGFNIKDLDSQNGTYVNGQRVTEHPLQDGDQIVIGDTQITFRMPWPGSGRAKA
jgi:hypothetical protein